MEEARSDAEEIARTRSDVDVPNTGSSRWSPRKRFSAIPRADLPEKCDSRQCQGRQPRDSVRDSEHYSMKIDSLPTTLPFIFLLVLPTWAYEMGPYQEGMSP